MHGRDGLRLLAERKERENAVDEVWVRGARAVGDGEAVVGDVRGFGGREAAGGGTEREELGVPDEFVLFG